MTYLRFSYYFNPPSFTTHNTLFTHVHVAPTMPFAPNVVLENSNPPTLRRNVLHVLWELMGKQQKA